ncbi:MAG TPA: toll/interleukin-1 receptor domain-containing protein [Phycisphaerales bacterium]|nr:toll/interleukin-1 receptor domain-containing protein [Phycisphaerales bacterium]HMP36995.1 toll/interleukin-1 receptor domain-containing protein [Phycisphaerales bacterium]
MATVLLSIPPAILATWHLAERLGLLERVSRWLKALRAEPGAERVSVGLGPAGTRPLSAVTPGEVLDAAADAIPKVGPEEKDWDLFVIHAGADRAIARRLWEALIMHRVDAFLDRASLPPGADWPRRTQEAMARTRLFLVLVSASWDSGWYTGEEVARAISLCREGEREIERRGNRGVEGRSILPVVMDASHWQPHQLPYGRADRQPIVLGGLEEKEQARTVVEAVLTALGRRARDS